MTADSPKAPIVMVVEDNPTNLLLTRAILQRGGYQTVSAASSDEAWARLASIEPSVILMDIQLPGKDGLTITRELRQNPATAHIPVVALTANAMQGDAERCLAAGCDAYLTKPVEAQTLRDLLARLIPASNGATS